MPSRSDTAHVPSKLLSSRPHPVPLGIALVAVLVALSAIVQVDPVRDAVTHGRVNEVSLRIPAGYLLFAPLSNVLDTLTLMSARQHIVLVATIIVVYAVWWWRWGRVGLEAALPARRALRELARLGVGLVVLVALYAAAAVLPRPMARLDASPDVMTVDFHTHTRYSHDGRPDWTPDAVRKWHRDAGFDVAFITDHRTFEGARDAWANNPPSVGQETVLLPAIEVVWKGEHVNVLDADRMYRGILNSTLRDIDDQALTMVSMVPGAEPVLIETLPGDLSKVQAASGKGTPGVRAIEVIDGSPRGLGQTRAERSRIIHLADSTNIALVAGSDNHGWGHTAAGWTLMFIPDWRSVSPDGLSKAIANVLRVGGRGATRVVERFVANTETGLSLPLSVPLVGWGMLRALSTDERVVWLAWCLLAYLGWRLLVARRRASENVV
jgi:Predicted metal-dependent phosphoesterases (PHP family)